MVHYRAVMLVLASNEQIYKNCRKIWKKYMYIDPTIKVFFVYGQLNHLDDYDSSDLIFQDIKEGHPLYIKKTIEAMKIIHRTITYDFFIFTNFELVHIVFRILSRLLKISKYFSFG